MNNDHQNREKADDNVVKEPVSSPSRSSPVRHNFPDKLHYVLNEMAKDGLEDIMSWQPHGRCFVVHDQTRLQEQILPTWFRQSRFSSFQRQLNIYGFSRIPKGPDKGGYYHVFFLRGKPELAQNIPRQKFKGTGARKASNEDDVPDFYRMSPMPPAAVVALTEARSETATPPPQMHEPVEIRDAAPWTTPPAQRAFCYELLPPNRMPQPVYASPTMSRRHGMPELNMVCEGARRIELLARGNRAWSNQSPPPAPGYFCYSNMHQQRAAMEPPLCQPTFEK